MCRIRGNAFCRRNQISEILALNGPDCKRAQKVIRLNMVKYIFRVENLDNKGTVENSSNVRESGKGFLKFFVIERGVIVIFSFNEG